MDSKCSAAGVDVAVAKQLLVSLDYARVCREARASLAVIIGDKKLTLEAGEDYFLDAREVVRRHGPEDLAWAVQ